eukprot:gnl/TRDRNA2_/TRDRNA2_180212_c0_seq1.p1 gnl/TRDRNA2_/TRDRNA2_180212_c0~~gnl/TRDRNA2_/TRDRNA2_180212_c0_seq1.p1  ORF type:complete len:270 (-),score=53.13 gnl/TRDRNA2_/TRDRNA2_180212_c0_seq1:191-979(-)
MLTEPTVQAEASFSEQDLQDKLFDRASKAPPLASHHLDATTLGKSGGARRLTALAGSSLKSTRASPSLGLFKSSLRTAPVQRPRTVQVSASALEGLKPAAEAYSAIWVPFFQEAQKAGLPDAIIHWGHPVAMGTVLLTMGVFGTYLGWQVRAGNGDMSMGALTLGESAAELHPKLMGGAAFFFFLGGQGGLVLSAVQGRPLLESTHAVSAVAGLTLLLVQAALPLAFDKTPATRSAHAYLGSATMALLFFHMAQGISLGNSF